MRTLFAPKPKASPVQEPAKKQSSGFTLFQTKKQAVPTTPTTKIDKAAEYKKRESAVSAFDFSKARSRRDAELLYEAKYGEWNGKMSKEQYQALRRKVGGTAKDYWKTFVDVKGEYTDKGWVDKSESSNVTANNVPALPFLILTVVALFGTLGYVVAQTS